MKLGLFCACIIDIGFLFTCVLLYTDYWYIGEAILYILASIFIVSYVYQQRKSVEALPVPPVRQSPKAYKSIQIPPKSIVVTKPTVKKYHRELKLKENGGSHTRREWIELCDYYHNICLRCKERKPLTKDHVIPIYHGGTDNIDNIQPLCKSCNSRKRTKIIDYRKGFINGQNEQTRKVSTC